MKGVAHVGYRLGLGVVRCARYAFSCGEDIHRTLTVPAALGVGISGGGAIIAADCAGDGPAAVATCGFAVAAGVSVSGTSLAILVGYATSHSEESPFDYEHCNSPGLICHVS